MGSVIPNQAAFKRLRQLIHRLWKAMDSLGWQVLLKVRQRTLEKCAEQRLHLRRAEPHDILLSFLQIELTLKFSEQIFEHPRLL